MWFLDENGKERVGWGKWGHELFGLVGVCVGVASVRVRVWLSRTTGEKRVLERYGRRD